MHTFSDFKAAVHDVLRDGPTLELQRLRDGSLVQKYTELSDDDRARLTAVVALWEGQVLAVAGQHITLTTEPFESEHTVAIRLLPVVGLPTETGAASTWSSIAEVEA